MASFEKDAKAAVIVVVFCCVVVYGNIHWPTAGVLSNESSQR